MFAYCNNNPVIHEDPNEEFLDTLLGGLIGGLVAMATRTDGESAGQAFCRGAITGAIAGAALDLSIATAGAGAAVALAAFGGFASSAIDTAWEAANHGRKADFGEILINGATGAATNVLFMGMGRVPKRAVGKTVKAIFQASYKNSVSGFTTKAGSFLVSKALRTTWQSTAATAVQTGFNKIYSWAATRIREMAK